MSNRRTHFDLGPMVGKVQKDIINLCYLGLHQHAKENKLIGRSRPLLNDDMTPYYIRRLFFRLTVACVQQMIGSVNWDHGGTPQQVNYINVGGYKVLRLYGLLDREMFLLQRERSFPLWQNCVPRDDWEHLSQERPLSEIEEFLTLPTRAMIEVGGDRFTTVLRSAMQYIRTDEDIKLHVQYEPRDSTKVRNIAIDLQLFDLPYVGGAGPGGWQQVPGPGRNLTIARGGHIEVPCHIEQIISFRDDVWPFVNGLMNKEVRETFLYLVKNWPSGDAIQLKVKEIQMSQEERERREREVEEAAQAHDTEMNALRDRFRVAFGDQRPASTPEEMAEALLNRAAEPDVDDGFTAQVAEQIPDPVPTEICIICNGDWDQCDCCGDCNTTEDECTCWQCGDCGEHTDECICGQCGACGHEECRCCPECDESPCQCQELEDAVSNGNETLNDEEKQRAIEELRQKVSNTLGLLGDGS